MKSFIDIASRTFVDLRGRTWEINLTWSMFERVKREAGFDLEQLIPHEGTAKEALLKTLQGLLFNVRQFYGVLWAIFRPQCEAANITQDDFGDAFSGETFEKAFAALIGGLVYFFPTQAQKEALTGVIEMMLRMSQAATKRAKAEIEKIDYDQAASEYIAHLKKSFGVPPEPSASPTPAPTA